MLDKSKTYLIVGLGLLGGKYAQVLSQKGYNVTGITHSQSTLDYALQHDRKKCNAGEANYSTPCDASSLARRSVLISIRS